jgi:DNA-binding transcriptional LysR family regulator
MSETNLNGRHLRIFATVMKSRSLAEAAFKLGISEPAVSKTLRLIEREAGVPLFTREGGRLKPTPAAKLLLPHAHRATLQLDSALNVAYALGKPPRRRLSVAVHAPPLIAIVSRALQRFRAQSPGVEIELLIESPRNVLRMVSQQEIDVGVTNQVLAQPGRAPDMCERRTVSEDLLVAALPPHHPFASRSVVRPEDLAHETIIALPDDSPTTILVEAAFREQRVVLHSQIVAADSLGVCALVQQGVGIGLINPLLLADGIFPGIEMRPFRPRIALLTEVYYSSIRPLSDDAAQFIGHIEQVAASRPWR